MYIVCHYGEIGLKGKNRVFFEKKLIENIKKALGSAHFEFIRRISGRVIVKFDYLNDKERQIIASQLKKVFGLVYFTFAYSCPQDIQDIKKAVLEIARKKSFNTFRVRVARSNKKFPLTSPEVERGVGEYILKNFKHRGDKKIEVDLENPDITFYIEIVENNYIFLYTEKIKGLGGLPVGVSGKAVCLLSGGIDSPVAAFYAMKRGVKVVFLHFYTDLVNKGEEKINRIVKILNQYQFGSQLYLIPFLNIQKVIFEDKDTSLSCLLCKRMMMRIAQNIALNEGAQAIITGDNIGQVADQTLNNLGIVQEVSEIPVISPVVCEDKLDIIKKAEEIGTYSISNIPEKFYCQKFLPFRPNTKASLSEVQKRESRIDIDKLVLEAVKKAKRLIFY